MQFPKKKVRKVSLHFLLLFKLKQSIISTERVISTQLYHELETNIGFESDSNYRDEMKEGITVL